MIEIHGDTSVSALMSKLLSSLVQRGGATLLSVNGVIGASLTESFRKACFDFNDIKGDSIRFVVEATEGTCDVIMGTETTIDMQGSYAIIEGDNGTTVVGKLEPSNKEEGFWFESKTNGEDTTPPTDPDEPAPPQSVFTGFCSFTEYGLAILIYDHLSVKSGYGYSWFVFQRPVDVDGAPYVEDRAPVICVYASSKDWTDREHINYFILREHDVNRPSPSLTAVENTVDSVAIVNAKHQVSIAPSRKACLFFPYGFNTQRYYYSYELDLFAYASADVISMSSVVPDDRFGQRKYKAFNANGVNNTGMRILLLQEMQ